MTNPDNVGGLLPCPFCGSSDVKASNYEQGYWYHFVHCLNCEASADAKGETANAVAAWNRRASPGVGGLPELPEPAIKHDGPVSGRSEWYSTDQMRAYGELCRAAPAGGDVEVVRLRQLLAASQEQVRILSDMVERGQAHHERMMKLMDSAPAGSGEVEELAQRLDGYEQRSACMAHWSTQSGQRDDADYWSQHAKDMNTAAALLRKLQQGAE